MMERREKASKLHFLLVIFLFVFVILQMVAPLVHPKGSLTNLSGMTMVIDNDGLWDDLAQPWSTVYFTGDFLCHTKASRSFILNQNQLPFCARCTAIWVGLVAGLGIMVVYQIKNQYLFLTAFLISIGFLGVDGVGQLLGFWESTNVLRALTGAFVGLFTGLAIGLVVDEFRNIEIKKKEKKN